MLRGLDADPDDVRPRFDGSEAGVVPAQLSG
jgi:hypothetical protein